MKWNLTALLCVVAVHYSLSQGDFRGGFVILANGDSLNGNLAYDHGIKSPSYFKFKFHGSSGITAYSASEVRAFGQYFDKRFEARNLPGRSTGSRVFVEMIVKGFMSLLKQNGALYVEKNDGTILKLNKKQDAYVSVLNELVADCSLKADETPFDQRLIAYLIQNYNRCHHNLGIIYTPLKQKYVLAYQAFSGVQSTKIFDDGPDKKYLASSVSPVFGVGVDFSLPRIIDKLFISAECVYTKQNFQYYEMITTSTYIDHYDYFIHQSVLKFPVGLRYNLSGEYNTFYFKAGVVSAVTLKRDVDTIKEQEKATEVVTTYASSNLKGSQAGLFGSIGYSRGIANKVKGFVEFRMEKGKCGKKNSTEDYLGTHAFVFLGLRF